MLDYWPHLIKQKLYGFQWYNFKAEISLGENHIGKKFQIGFPETTNFHQVFFLNSCDLAT